MEEKIKALMAEEAFAEKLREVVQMEKTSYSLLSKSAYDYGSEKYAATGSSPAAGYADPSKALEEISQAEEVTFGEYLCDLIAEKGMKTSQVYNAANISKQAFSRIRNNESRPLRQTVAGFAMALHLTEEEAELLYQKAGYHLSDEKKDKFDFIVRSFLKNHQYNVFENNIFLYNNGLPQLGSNRPPV